MDLVKVITAPEETSDKDFNYSASCNNPFKVFLGGGITNCRDWQKEVIKHLEHRMNNIMIFNPRRDTYIPTDRNMEIQIAWEAKYLPRCNMLVMNFVEGESEQPICLYELGRYVPDYVLYTSVSRPILINISSKYKRYKEVIYQLKYSMPYVNTSDINIDLSDKEIADIIVKKSSHT